MLDFKIARDSLDLAIAHDSLGGFIYLSQPDHVASECQEKEDP